VTDPVGRRELTDTEIYEGELEAGTDPMRGGLRSDETDDPNVAAEEGFAYVPPTDPPVVADATNLEDARIAAGFGATSMDEPYDADHHSELVPSEDEVTERVREALRADAATTMYADSLRLSTEGDIVIVRGEVDDIDDTDNIVEVASRVDGVDQVVERLDVRGVTD
jgi:hypothetical protein